MSFSDCCSVSVGETKTTVSPLIMGGVSDGQWHVVQVQYYNKVRFGWGWTIVGLCA